MTAYDIWLTTTPEDRAVIVGECVCGEPVYAGESAYHDQRGEWVHDSLECLAEIGRMALTPAVARIDDTPRPGMGYERE